MRLYVQGGRSGAQLAAAEGRVAIVVDALRASATTASLLHYGAERLIVVEALEEAFSEARRLGDVALVGERGCVRVEGFDLGNSPLQAPEPRLRPTVVFSSSNMSRCCVGAATAPAVFLGSLVTASACARLAWQAAHEGNRDVQLIPAGAAEDEYRFVLEDYVAAGGLLQCLLALAADRAVLADDAARAAVDLHTAAVQRGMEATFLGTDNGRFLVANGFREDVRFASNRDVFVTVPRVTETYPLADGGTAAVLQAG